MKYIIDIPSSQEYSYDKDFKSLDLKFHGDNFSGMTRFDAEPYTEPDREAIEDEVWEFARGLLNYTDDDWETITNMLLLDIPYQSAKASYEAWLKRKDEIRVGDEVVYADDPNKEKAIVLRLYQPKQYKTLADILCEDGTVIKMIKVENLAWTGRHFDEVEELLKKMEKSNEN